MQGGSSFGVPQDDKLCEFYAPGCHPEVPRRNYCPTLKGLPLFSAISPVIPSIAFNKFDIHAFICDALNYPPVIANLITDSMVEEKCVFIKVKVARAFHSPCCHFEIRIVY